MLKSAHFDTESEYIAIDPPPLRIPPFKIEFFFWEGKATEKNGLHVRIRSEFQQWKTIYLNILTIKFIIIYAPRATRKKVPEKVELLQAKRCLKVITRGDKLDKNDVN